MPSPSSETSHARLPANERREQLLATAVDLFSRKGFNGTTTREIAAAAGVTEAIIFRHFETKDQLYTAIIDQKMSSAGTSEWFTVIRKAMQDNDDEAVIKSLICAIVETHKTDPKFERLMLYAALEGNEIALVYMRKVSALIVEDFRNYLSRRQKQGRMAPVGPDAALSAIIGMAQHYALGRYVHSFKEQCLSDEQAVETFTRVAMHGLCTPEGVGK